MDKEMQLREKDQNLLKDDKAMDAYVQGLMQKYFWYKLWFYVKYNH